MTDSEALLHESNGLAHEVARAALKSKEANEEAIRFWRSPEPTSGTGFLLWRHEKEAVLKNQDEAHWSFCRALDAYEEAERRARTQEATA